MSAEEAGNQRPNNVVVAEATRNFTKKLRESGFGPANVTFADMGSDSSKVQSQNPAEQSSTTAASKVHDATKVYIKKLIESGYEPPMAKLVEKNPNSSGKQNNDWAEPAGSGHPKNIQEVTPTYIEGLKQSDQKQQRSPSVTRSRKRAPRLSSANATANVHRKVRKQ